MHLTVFVWGFTAILGRLISVGAIALVWYRLVFVVLVMGRLLRTLYLAGVFVALHWLLFYGCIKYAGVAVAVLCLSSLTFFTALLEPVVFRRSLRIGELTVGFLVMVGVSLLVRLEAHADMLGLAMGLGSAFFSAAFGTLNGRLSPLVRGEVMTFYELSSATVVTTVFVVVWPGQGVTPWTLSLTDLGLLLALAVGCTVLPWLWSLRVLRTLSPYTVALAVSLEPVYSMLLAYFIFPDAERLHARFYAGTGILLTLVAANTWVRRARTQLA